MNAAAVVLIAFAIGFQGLAGGSYRVGGVTPDFPFLALAWLALYLRPADSLLLASLAALVIDFCSLDPLGTRLLGYLPAVALIGRLRRGFIAESLVPRAALTLCAAVIAFSLEGGYLWYREERWQGLGREFAAACYTALVGCAFHALLDCYRGRRGSAGDRFFA